MPWVSGLRRVVRLHHRTLRRAVRLGVAHLRDSRHRLRDSWHRLRGGETRRRHRLRWRWRRRSLASELVGAREGGAVVLSLLLNGGHLLRLLAQVGEDLCVEADPLDRPLVERDGLIGALK